MRYTVKSVAALCSLLLCSGGLAAESPKGKFDLPTPSAQFESTAEFAAEAGAVLWSHEVIREGARAIAVRLDDVILNGDDLIAVHNAERELVQLLSVANVDATGTAWTDSVAGESVYIELISGGGKGVSSLKIGWIRASVGPSGSPEAERAAVDAAYNTVLSPDLPHAIDQLANNITRGPDGKVIYGDDDRREVYQVTDQRLRDAARSTCMIVLTSDITNNGDGTYTLSNDSYVSMGGALCPDEPYFGQPNPGYCSAFLVGRDLIATAGHCISTSSMASRVFIFDFQVAEGGVPPSLTIPADRVYFPSQVVNQALGSNLDHAVVKVDRQVVGRTPFQIRRVGEVALNTPLVVIGHPSGLPTKIAGGALVKNVRTGIPYFDANLDTYGGNSGSAVFNLNTMVVEGILVRGQADFRTRSGDTCRESNRLPDTGGTGTNPFEDVSKTISFKDFVPQLATQEGTLTFDRPRYRTDQLATITLSDSDLAAAPSASVLFAIDGDSTNTLVLQPVPNAPGVFELSLSLDLFPLEDGDTLTAIYADGDRGDGNSAEVIANAVVDTLQPTITLQGLKFLNAHSAIFRFDFNKPVRPTLEVYEGTTLFRTASATTFAPSQTLTVAGLSPLTDYTYLIKLVDEVGYTATVDNGAAKFLLRTRENVAYPLRFYTQPTALDSLGTTIEYHPAPVANEYLLFKSEITSPLLNEAESTTFTLVDDGSQEISLGAQRFNFFGTEYDRVYINSNGNLSFGAASNSWEGSIEKQFAAARISPHFVDLNPELGGKLRYLINNERLIATWVNVPYFAATDVTVGATLQAELYFETGIIKTTVYTDAGRNDQSVTGINPNFTGNVPTVVSGTIFSSLPTPTPSSVVYTEGFDGKNDPWAFLPIPGFDYPTPVSLSNARGFTSTSNVNTVGMLESTLDVPVQPDGDTVLYRSRYKVRSSLADQRVVPSVRFRISPEEYQLSDILLLTSEAASMASPTQLSRDVLHYFTMPARYGPLRISYDFINQYGSNAANATVLLESVAMDRILLSDLKQQSTASLPVAASSWVFLGYYDSEGQPFFVVPRDIPAEDKLGIVGNTTGGTAVQVGSWTSLPFTNLNLREDRLYRFDFGVSTTHADVSGLPSFRVRLNDGQNTGSWMNHVEPRRSTDLLPGSTPTIYPIYFLPNVSTGTAQVTASFDFILVPKKPEDLTAELFLNSLTVTEFLIP